MKHKKSKVLYVAASALMALVILMTGFLSACGDKETTTTAATEEPVTLVFTSHNAGNGIWASFVGKIFDEMESRSNGLIQVEQHWNAELVGLTEAYDAMLQGTVDMAEFFPSMLAGRFPMDDVVAFAPYDEYCYRFGQVVYELGQTFPEMLEPYDDAKLLWRNPGWSVGMGTIEGRPLRDLASSKGYKLVPVGQWSAALMTAFGWAPTSVPPEEGTSALQTGVTDGSGVSYYLLWELGWGEIMRYITVPVRVDEMLVDCSMSWDAWEKLPKSAQDVIDAMIPEIPGMFDQMVGEYYEWAAQEVETEFGIEVIHLSAADQAKMNELTLPVRAEFVQSLNDQGLPGQALMDKFLELHTKYSDAQYKPTGTYTPPAQ